MNQRREWKRNVVTQCRLHERTERNNEKEQVTIGSTSKYNNKSATFRHHFMNDCVFNNRKSIRGNYKFVALIVILVLATEPLVARFIASIVRESLVAPVDASIERAFKKESSRPKSSATSSGVLSSSNHSSYRAHQYWFLSLHPSWSWTCQTWRVVYLSSSSSPVCWDLNNLLPLRMAPTIYCSDEVAFDVFVLLALKDQLLPAE